MASGYWRLAKSLETLRSQVNRAYPNRNKASDGTIGDASHAASASDHNPNRNGVVTALDLTHDPKNGFDAGKFAEHLRTHRHPNLRYIIFNRRIAGWWNNWQWQPASGHEKHVHVSVGTLGVGDGQTYDRYDSTKEWDINVKEKPKMQRTALKRLVKAMLNRDANEEDKKKYLGKDPNQVIMSIDNWARKNGRTYGQTLERTEKELAAATAALQKSSAALAAAKASGQVSTELKAQLSRAQSEADKALRKVSELEAERELATSTGNAFLRWLGDLLNKFQGGK